MALSDDLNQLKAHNTGGLVTTTMRLPTYLYNLIKLEADDHGLSITALVTRMLIDSAERLMDARQDLQKLNDIDHLRRQLSYRDRHKTGSLYHRFAGAPKKLGLMEDFPAMVPDDPFYGEAGNEATT